ncbi:uncharacterized protein METZ01_LOCUS168134 [marine metagenome]|uniref:50S ribosomal protein L10 n=1 Tax=marine metagenome TaxID=408172 RepID=A0A382BN68_9ZZZZ
MALRLEDKKALVAEVNEIATTSLAAIAAEYRGLTVAQMTKFRAKARREGVYVRVIKNTLAKRAIEGTEFECLTGALEGPLLLAFSRQEPGAAARLVKEFARKNDALVAKAVAIGGDLYPSADIDRLARLPTLDGARAQLLALLQAPISKFVRTLAEPTAKIARLLAAYKDQKQAA